MDCRLWFWSRERPRPKVIAECSGGNLALAALDGFAPVRDRAWKHVWRGDQFYLLRGQSGYCCEPVDGPGPRALIPPPKRERIRLRICVRL